MNINKVMVAVLKFLVPAYDFAWNAIHYPKLIYKPHFIAEIFYRYIPLTFFFVWLFSLFPAGRLIYIFIMLLGVYSIYDQSKVKGRFQNALFYFVILNFGFLGIRSFVGHTFLAGTVAESIGWVSGSMFQIELAFYHLGTAVAALAYIWMRSRGLIFGLIITKAIFLFGAMGVHIFEAVVNSNFNTGNIGPSIIYGDLVIPALVIFLFVKSKQVKD